MKPKKVSAEIFNSKNEGLGQSFDQGRFHLGIFRNRKYTEETIFMFFWDLFSFRNE